MELLEKKLEVQRNICLFGVLLTLAVYFLIWYFSECWALPFQESRCKRMRDLPLIATNQSTLAEAVDEFTLVLRALIDKFRDTIETQDLTDRQVAFNVTKNAVGQLLSQHASDLVGFGARKRENKRLEDVEVAIADVYMLTGVFSGIYIILMIMLDHAMKTFKAKNPEIEIKSLNAIDKQEYLHNSRLKQLKRLVSLLYMATFICLAAIVAFIFTFVVGQYFDGSSTIFFPSYAYRFDEKADLTKLEAGLDKEFSKTEMFMTSSIEVRRAIWLYEIDDIDTHIKHYEDIKQYHFDRRTMPRKVGRVLPSALSYFFSFPLIFCIPLFIYFAVRCLYTSIKCLTK